MHVTLIDISRYVSEKIINIEALFYACTAIGLNL